MSLVWAGCCHLYPETQDHLTFGHWAATVRLCDVRVVRVVYCVRVSQGIIMIRSSAGSPPPPPELNTAALDIVLTAAEPDTCRVYV